MVRLSAALSLLAAAGSVAQSRVNGRYIVEFDETADVPSFKNTINRLNVHTKMNLEYKLFKGVSIEMKDLKTENTTLEEIKKAPGVKVMPYIVYPAPNDKIEWLGTPGKDYSNIRKREEGVDAFSTHVQTQVDQLRAKGITGKGIKIGVIDTGIDYLHPALGGCFGEGCLVSFGTDLTGDAYAGENSVPVPDDDPMDCAGHGTHVAGIIAAQANSFGFTGTAPGVTLGAYKSFGCNGGVGNDVLIAAFNQAFEDGADIITASIGGPSGWSEEPWSVAVERIVEQGVPCTLAAGNDGSVGMFYSSTASAGKRVISVASVDNVVAPSLMIPSNYTIEEEEEEEFLWTEGSPANWGNVSLPLRAVDFNITDEANGCNPWPEDTEDLSGNIVLIRRGTCTFVQKATLAAQHGAKYILLYNNVPGAVSVDVTEVPQIEGIAMVTPETGVAWIKALEAGQEVVVSMVSPDLVEPSLIIDANNSTGGSLSSFTSWGPTWELDTRPLVASPGGKILSTYPRMKGSYGVLSGTSMATPLVAAVIALLMEVRGKEEPWVFENLLSNTAQPLDFNNGEGPMDFLSPVPQQGNGLIRAFVAAYSTTVLDKSHLSFNDTDNFVQSVTFNILNQGEEEVTYTMGNLQAATSYLKANASSTYATAFPNELTDDYAELVFDPEEVTVPAGGKAEVKVVAKPHPNLEAERLPIWSGWVSVNGSDGSSYNLAYQGATGSMHSLKVIGNAYLTAIPPLILPFYPPARDNLTFVLPPMGTANATNSTLTNTTYPGINIELAMGSILVYCDIVPMTTCPPNGTQEVMGYKSLGQHRSFPIEWQTREAHTLLWDGELSDGSFAPAGKYKFVFRALKIFGDRDNKDDFEVVESKPFRIRYDELRAPITIISPPQRPERRAAEQKQGFVKRWFDLARWL